MVTIFDFRYLVRKLSYGYTMAVKPTKILRILTPLGIGLKMPGELGPSSRYKIKESEQHQPSTNYGSVECVLQPINRGNGTTFFKPNLQMAQGKCSSRAKSLLCLLRKKESGKGLAIAHHLKAPYPYRGTQV
jgi:hypothetical protein